MSDPRLARRNTESELAPGFSDSPRSQADQRRTMQKSSSLLSVPTAMSPEEKPKSKIEEFMTSIKKTFANLDSPSAQRDPRQKIQRSGSSNGIKIVSVGSTSQGSFFEHEILHNRFLSYLDENKELYVNFIRSIITDKMIILLPQDITLDNIEINDEFLFSHAIRIVADSEMGALFITSNGITGSIDEKREFVRLIDNPADRADSYETEVQQTQSETTDAEDYNPAFGSQKTFRVLRQGQIQIAESPPIIVYIITNPFWVPVSSRLTPSVLEGPETSTSSSSAPATSKSSTSALNPSKLYYAHYLSYQQKIQQPQARKYRDYVKRFILDYRSKPTQNYNERVERIYSFMDQLMAAVRESEIWSKSSEEEIEVARVCLTKTILSQLYNDLFGPPEFYERDQRLQERVRQLSFIKPHHLDLQASEWDESYLEVASGKLQQMKSFKGPSDKLDSLLQCCKVITMMIDSKGGTSCADDFLPHVIYLLLRVNQDDLYSEIEYLKEFCPKNEETAEGWYYLTIFESAIYFIENINAKVLNMDQDTFDRCMRGEIVDVEPKPKQESKPKESKKDDLFGLEPNSVQISSAFTSPISSACTSPTSHSLISKMLQPTSSSSHTSPSQDIPSAEEVDFFDLLSPTSRYAASMASPSQVASTTVSTESFDSFFSALNSVPTFSSSPNTSSSPVPGSDATPALFSSLGPSSAFVEPNQNDPKPQVPPEPSYAAPPPPVELIAESQQPRSEDPLASVSTSALAPVSVPVPQAAPSLEALIEENKRQMKMMIKGALSQLNISFAHAQPNQIQPAQLPQLLLEYQQMAAILDLIRLTFVEDESTRP